MAAARPLILASAVMLVFILTVEIGSVEACTPSSDFNDLTGCASNVQSQTPVMAGSGCCTSIQKTYQDDPNGACLCAALGIGKNLGLVPPPGFVANAVATCLPGQTVVIPSC